MTLQKRKRIAAVVLHCSAKRVRFQSDRLEDIKGAITKADIRGLVKEGAVSALPKKGVSRGRARKIKLQKVKGQRKGKGSRKGTKTARSPSKEVWMNKIRAQRGLLRNLKTKESVSKETYRKLYRKASGGFFRSKRHIILYLEEQGLLKNEKK